MKRRLITFFLLMIFLIPGFCFAGAETDTEWVASIRVNPYGGKENDPESISVFQKDESYYLFLPTDTDETKIRVWHDPSSGLAVDGNEVVNGAVCPEFARAGKHMVSLAGDQNSALTIEILISQNIPAMFITTRSKSLDYVHEDKANREPGQIRVHDHGKMICETDLQQLSGRGNATWTYPKKPYNIKFKAATDLLGMKEARSWTLLANYVDPTFLKNPAAWYLADELGLKYTSDYRHVDLYANGEYLGNYIVCGKVEIGENRIDINDLERENKKRNGDLSLFPQIGSGRDGAVLTGNECSSGKWIDLPQEPENVSGGYLLEFETVSRYEDELCGFVTDHGQSIVIKEPEHAGAREAEYISSLVNEAESALYSPTGTNEQGKHFSDCFDLDSMAAMYLVRETGMDIDAGLSSCFVIKAEDSDKLLFSPVWDMDRAFGDHLIRYGVDYGDPTIWWANSLYTEGDNRIPAVFNAAYRQEDFRKTVRNKWNEIEAAGTFEKLKAFLREKEKMLGASAVMDAIRWGTYGTGDTDKIRAEYSGSCEDLMIFLESREKSLNKGFSEDAVMLYYDANGGNGGIFNPKILSKGETTVVLRSVQGENEISPSEDRFVFSHWNTKADGTGKNYEPDDEIAVERDTVLYAQWKEKPMMMCSVADIAENGDIILNISKEELAKAGIYPGDSLVVTAEGYSGILPYYTGKVAADGEAMLCAVPGNELLVICTGNPDFSADNGIECGTGVSIELKETEGAMRQQRDGSQWQLAN